MFSITGNFAHKVSCGCCDCTPVQAALWAVRGVLFDSDPEYVLSAMRADGYATTHADDPFIALELILASVLANAFTLAATEAEIILKPAFEPPFNRAEIDDALAKAQVILGGAFDTNTRVQVEILVDKLITNGALDAVAADRPASDPTPENIDQAQADVPVNPDDNGDGAAAALLALAALADNPTADGVDVVAKDTILEDNPAVEDILQGIVDSADYYTNAHFNDVIMPEIQDRISALLEGADPASVPDPTDIFEYISRRLKSVPYWRVVANAAASRGYHYGFLKAGSMSGATSYELVAILDDRTSDICEELDGKVFYIGDAVSLMESAIGTGTDMTKQLMPWLNFADIDGADVNELRDLGFMVPPFHGNCRTTVKFIYGPSADEGDVVDSEY